MNAFRRSRPQPTHQPDGAAERAARHLRYCQELIEIGMWLARAAAERAADDIAAPPPVAAIPGSSAAVIAQLENKVFRRGPDCGRWFAHFSRATRQAMLLEIFIAEGFVPTPATHTDSAAAAPSRIPAPGPSLHAEPLDREPLDPLDWQLPTNAHGKILVEQALQDISTRLGLSLSSHQTSADPAPADQPPPPPDTPAPAPSKTPAASKTPPPKQTARKPHRRR